MSEDKWYPIVNGNDSTVTMPLPIYEALVNELADKQERVEALQEALALLQDKDETLAFKPE